MTSRNKSPERNLSFQRETEHQEQVKLLMNALEQERQKAQELAAIARELMAYCEGIAIASTSPKANDVIKVVLGNYWGRVRSVAGLKY